PCRRNEWRIDRADCKSARPVPSSEDALRRRVHRLAGHELHPLPDRAERRRIARTHFRQNFASGARGTVVALSITGWKGTDAWTAARAHHRTAAQRSGSELRI